MNNIHNQLVSAKDIESIINNHVDDKNIDVIVNDINVFRKAFMHKSFVIKDDSADIEDNTCIFELDDVLSSNERLEFLGDAFLNLATAEYLFEKFPGKNEGDLTKLRSRLVRNTQLSYLGEKLGFNKWLLISTHIERISGRDNPRLVEDVFESFIAAVYKDQGHDICKKFIFNCFDTYIDLDFIINNNDNYKDILLRFFQTKSWNHPIYHAIFFTGEVYVREFTTVVIVKKDLYKEGTMNNQMEIFKELSKQENQKYGTCGEKYGTCDEKCNNCKALKEIMKDNYIICKGVGKTIKKSEQEASKKALEILKVPKNF